MNKIDQIFIDLLKQKIPENISATEVIAAALGINYDAAYRRLNNKVSFNLKETVILSKKYDISLNNLYEVGESNSYLIKSSKPIESLNDFSDYLAKVNDDLLPLVGKEDASITFSTRELPMFYFFEQSILIHFKMYIWLFILIKTPISKRIHFQDFVVSDDIIARARSARKTYDNINVTEMWSFGALNNILQQLLFLFRMQLISLENATEVCNALVLEIKNVEIKTQKREHSKVNSFKLYSNELFMMNNSMILKNKNKIRFTYPYALLKYFIINSQEACLEQEAYIDEQKSHSINVSSTSIKEHALFFNSKYEKIKQVLLVMKNEEEKPVFL